MRYELEEFAEFVQAELPSGDAGGHNHAAAPPIPDRIPEGRRRSELLSMMGTMRRRGANEEEMRAAAVAMNKRCDPPLGDRELFEMAKDVAERYAPAQTARAAPAAVTEVSSVRSVVTELANAERLKAKHGEDIRFASDRGIWSAWDEQLWAANDTGAVVRLMHGVAKGIYAEAANTEDRDMSSSLGRWAEKSDNLRVMKNSIEMACHLPGIEVQKFADVFDRHPELLNVRNGTIDLRTGEIREHRREDFLTKIIDIEYDPAAKCPKFQLFLHETFPQPGMAGYVTRIMGYFLSGFVSEQCWWVWCGQTATGKSTLINVIHRLLGPYAFALPENYFLLAKGATDYITANLAGVRFASSVETPDGKKLDVAKIKRLTGGDAVTASLKYQNAFTFNMEAKLVLATNFAPVVPAGDDALWRRLRVVPFGRKPLDPADRVRDLAEKLFAEEAQGILRLAVLGSVARFQNGLDEPPAVLSAIAEYRSDNDSVQAFLGESTTPGPESRVVRKLLYREYAKWAEENGVPPMSTKRLAVELRRLGIQGDHSDRYWIGIALNDKFSTAGAE